MNEALPVSAPRATGLRVIGVSFLAQMLVAGATTYSFGYFITPISEEFGASRTAVSSGQSIFMLVAAALLPLVGRLIDASPVRRMLLVGAVLMGTGLAAISQVAFLWQAALLLGLVALGSSLCGSLPAFALIVRAFPEGRERALGLASLGTSAGGALLPLLAAWLIEATDWRSALLFMGTTSAVLLGVSAWLGTPPDSDRPVLRDPAQRAADLSWGGVLRTRNFWPITVSMMLVYGSNTALIAHLPPLARDHGIPAGNAALLVSTLAISSLAGKLVYTAIGNRLDPRMPIWLASAVMVPALFLLLVAPRFEVMLAMAVANGLGTGGLLPAWSALVARCFGAAQFAGVMGLSRMCAYPLIATGGVLAALSKDLTDSYDLAFQGFLAASLVVAVLPFLMRVPARV